VLGAFGNVLDSTPDRIEVLANEGTGKNHTAIAHAGPPLVARWTPAPGDLL
jgi:hypothetical protein